MQSVRTDWYKFATTFRRSSSRVDRRVVIVEFTRVRVRRNNPLLDRGARMQRRVFAGRRNRLRRIRFRVKRSGYVISFAIRSHDRSTSVANMAPHVRPYAQ